MYISLDNIVYSHTWYMFRLILYTADITTARTFIMYISLIFHDNDWGSTICFLTLVFRYFIYLCIFYALMLVIGCIIILVYFLTPY
ncbi:hypothetical protein L873DRAFT_1928381 [Choiromyces venosus 120613-1]|uniref:Uncharacterized protein n=1 Tax=Choiromyces venosus 120613-1 TaxID=1336337 RepID=A0A3N4K5N2_9PEZI|nr:hypothetical protein L873DRAFT_1928381 [Choiromyces venosus 120613-1]